MALSMDLRVRVLAAIDEGSSCRAAAARFGVAPSTAIRWQAQRRATGNFVPKPQGGDMRSRRIEERANDILTIWEARRAGGSAGLHRPPRSFPAPPRACDSTGCP